MFTFHDNEDLSVFMATGDGYQYQYADDDGLVIGGANGKSALSVMDHFKRGHSQASECYESEVLCLPRDPSVPLDQ